jgi:TetR/AcrR family transcriptional regulator, transcriptional repressor for nem operon
MDRTVSSWFELTEGEPVEQQFDGIVEAYLSHFHRHNHERGCALPALGADKARSSPRSGRIFARKLEEMINAVARLLPRRSQIEARQVAPGALASMMGSIVLARAVGDKLLSDDVLEAGRRANAIESRELSGAAALERPNRQLRTNAPDYSCAHLHGKAECPACSYG